MRIQTHTPQTAPLTLNHQQPSPPPSDPQDPQDAFQQQQDEEQTMMRRVMLGTALVVGAGAAAMTVAPELTKVVIGAAGVGLWANEIRSSRGLPGMTEHDYIAMGLAFVGMTGAVMLLAAGGSYAGAAIHNHLPAVPTALAAGTVGALGTAALMAPSLRSR